MAGRRMSIPATALNRLTSIGFSVSVEIPLPDDFPDVGIHITEPSSLHQLIFNHLPNRNIAAGVTPQDIAISVAVEVVGGNEIAPDEG